MVTPSAHPRPEPSDELPPAPDGCPVRGAGRAPEDPADRLLADPFTAYAALRATAPVHRITGPDGTPAWLVTRYEDVRSGLADPRLSLDKKNALPGGYHGFRLPPALDANLLNMDPPDHTRIRRLVARAFTPRRIERLREPVRRAAHALVDGFGSTGRVDLVTAYAGPLPVTVIGDLLGVPEGDRRDFRSWTATLLGPERPDPVAAKETVGAMLRFYTGLVADKRRAPGDDLLSDLVAVRDETAEPSPSGSSGPSGSAADGRLTEDELVSLAFLIHFAGYENAVHLIGNAALALLTHPEARAELRADPARWPAAVDELTRFDTPALLAFRRFPTEDVRIAGVTVGAGETVFLCLASANRDPERFPDADRLDLSRDASGQLALGHGIHYCLGASLARLEAEVALAVLLERLPGLALDGGPTASPPRRRTLRNRGLRELPVRF
ncbi:cytochrome P450 [Streptomyces sp. NPDC005955]|uniref:cytochrome P450 family protein n=1 Tax=Streptomyces sp. NPDC005955 TaxID=3364738 RepID=UPI00369ED98D